MMAPAAVALGFELRVLAEDESVCAVPAVASAPVGDYRNLATLRDFARGVDVLTFDHEHVPGEHLRALIDDGVNVQPGPAALVHAQDKLVMRAAVERLGLPNPAWAPVADVGQLLSFGERTGWPVVLKTPRGGYDGKGVLVIDDPDAARAAADWFTAATPLLAEAKVAFSRELSALVARTPGGERRAWPVVETIQVHGVCDEVLAPAPGLDPEVADAARRAALTLADELGVTGVMAVELFETPGTVPGFIINELAMRPHNSGHWTIDGSTTSQFEQHLRAVLDLPLGGTNVLGGAAVMKNVLGGANIDLYSAYPAAMAAVPEAKIHSYGKSVRPGRKIGHITVLSASAAELVTARKRATWVAQMISTGRDVQPPGTTTPHAITAQTADADVITPKILGTDTTQELP